MLPEIHVMPLEFLRPLWLLGLLVIVLFALLRYKNNKDNAEQPLIAAHLSNNIVTKASHSNKHQFAFNLMAAIACIALSGPTWRNIEMPVYEMEKAQVIVFDLSYSMFSTDLAPNRLSQAKFKAIDLIKQWGEGEKALIAYAGDAFTVAPLTRDGNAIINHIPHLSPDIMPVRGSRADLALEKAIELLKNAGYAQGHIVFICDDISEQQAKIMQERLKDQPWIVSILAVATPQGAPIKLPDGTLLKDNNDNIVVPKLEGQPLYDITRATNGLYLTARNNSTDIQQLGTFFDKKQTRKANSEQSGDDTFAIDDGYWLSFLLIPLFLLLFRKGVFFALLIAVSLPLTTSPVEAAETSLWKNDQQNAFQAYQSNDYETAIKLYDNAFDKGSALYKNKQYDQALAEFTQVTKTSPDDAKAFYNQGNSYAQLQQFDKAIEAYQRALKIDPDFKQAKENKQLLEQLKEQQQNEKQDKQDGQQGEQQDKQEGQQNEQQDKQDGQQSEQQDKQDGQQSDQQDKQDGQQSDQQDKQDGQQSDQQDKQDGQQGEQQDKQEGQQSDQQDKQDKQQEKNSEQDSKNAQQAQAAQQKQTESAETAENEPAQLLQAQQNEDNNQELEALPNWLKNMPDDPSILLRRKMQVEYQKRAKSQPVKQDNKTNNNGVIW